MKKILLAGVLLLSCAAIVKADVEFAYDAGAEVVSAYIWRGQYNGGLSFQPDLEVGFEVDTTMSFRAGVWGNIGASDWMFRKDHGDGSGYTMFMPELDVMLNFTAYGASVGMNHYYYCDGSNFFSWQKDADLIDEDGEVNTSTTTEVWAGYNFGYLFGVEAYINWYTTVAGNDFVEDKDGNLKRAWSSYLELGWTYEFEKVGMSIGGQIGMSPWKSDLYGNKKFAVTNISLRVGKTWDLDVCSLELFAQGSLNPDGSNIPEGERYKDYVYIRGAGEEKLYNQKLNGVIGVGIWF